MRNVISSITTGNSTSRTIADCFQLGGGRWSAPNLNQPSNDVRTRRSPEVVMGVHHPRKDDLAGHVEHLIGVIRQVICGANLLDQTVTGEQTTAEDLPALVVHRRQRET